MYIDTMLEYYHVAAPIKLDEMSDYQWAMKLVILEDLRKKEAS